MRKVAVCGCGGAHGFEWPAGGVVAEVVGLVRATDGHTLRHWLGGSTLPVKSGRQIDFSPHFLGTSAKFGRRARLIGEKVIGRSMSRFASPVGRRGLLAGRRNLRVFLPLGGAVLASRGIFALLHQPPRQHSRGVFFQPGIEQLRDLLAEIGGMAEPRQLVTLQRVPRRGEKELPRWLGFVVQGGLQEEPRQTINIVNIVNSTYVRTYCGKLCKSFSAKREASGFTGSKAKAL